MNISTEELNERFFKNFFMCAVKEKASHITIDFDDNTRTLIAMNDGDVSQHLGFYERINEGSQEWLDHNPGYPLCILWGGDVSH